MAKRGVSADCSTRVTVHQPPGDSGDGSQSRGGFAPSRQGGGSRRGSNSQNCPTGLQFGSGYFRSRVFASIRRQETGYYRKGR